MNTLLIVVSHDYNIGAQPVETGFPTGKNGKHPF